MKNKASLVLVLVLVIASAGVGYLVGSTNQRTVTELPSSSSAGGLELMVSLNSTSIAPSGKLHVNVSLYNSLSSEFNLSASNGWKVRGFTIAMWPPCYFSEPVEFIVMKGNLSLAELQAASANSSTTGGGCMEGGTVAQLLFKPNSNTAVLEGIFCTASCSPFQSSTRLDSNFTIDGYWTYPINSTEVNDIFTPVDGGVQFQYPEVAPVHAQGFVPGVYTLVVSDEWGQTDIIHFFVV